MVIQSLGLQDSSPRFGAPIEPPRFAAMKQMQWVHVLGGRSLPPFSSAPRPLVRRQGEGGRRGYRGGVREEVRRRSPGCQSGANFAVCSTEKPKSSAPFAARNGFTWLITRVCNSLRVSLPISFFAGTGGGAGSQITPDHLPFLPVRCQFRCQRFPTRAVVEPGAPH